MPSDSKVWVIDVPKKPRGNSPVTVAARQLSVAKPPAPTEASSSGLRWWVRVLAAYALGPIAAAWLVKGARRGAWVLAGTGSLAVAGALLAGWDGFRAWAETTRGGLLAWLLVVPTVVLIGAAVWGRAVAAAGRRHVGSPFAAVVRWRPWILAGMGLAVPGLGLLAAGARRRAAWAVTGLGPPAAAAVVLANARWLWERCGGPVPAGLSSTSLEVVLIGAMGAAGLGALSWLVQALEGARVAASRAGAKSDLPGLGLLVAMVVFAMAYRPVPVAEKLHDTARALREDGYRLAPLLLCEAAHRFDPARPVYLADIVALNRALGRMETARERRLELEERTKEHLLAVSRAEARVGTSPVRRSTRADGARGGGPWVGLRSPDPSEGATGSPPLLP